MQRNRQSHVGSEIEQGMLARFACADLPNNNPATRQTPLSASQAGSPIAGGVEPGNGNSKTASLTKRQLCCSAFIAPGLRIALAPDR